MSIKIPHVACAMHTPAPIITFKNDDSEAYNERYHHFKRQLPPEERIRRRIMDRHEWMFFYRNIRTFSLQNHHVL